MDDGAGAGRLVIAVVLVHAQGNVGIGPFQRVDHMREHEITRIAARAA